MAHILSGSVLLLRRHLIIQGVFDQPRVTKLINRRRSTKILLQRVFADVLNAILPRPSSPIAAVWNDARRRRVLDKRQLCVDVVPDDWRRRRFSNIVNMSVADAVHRIFVTAVFTGKAESNHKQHAIDAELQRSNKKR